MNHAVSKRKHNVLVNGDVIAGIISLEVVCSAYFTPDIVSLNGQLKIHLELPTTNAMEHALINIDLEATDDKLSGGPSTWKPTKVLQSPSPRPAISNINFWLPAWLNTRQRPQVRRETAHLDGLRGFAALLVYWHHHELWVHNGERTGQEGVFENGFGYKNEYYFATFPGIRLLFSGGHLAVSIFFVLSGYVLSIKPLRLIEGHDMIGLADHLGSALFRRWLRLYIPVAVTTVVYATTWHLFGGMWVDGITPKSDWFSEMWFLYCEFKNLSFLFKDGGLPWLTHNVHLWSIPIEFKGSMIIFVSLLASSRCSLKARLCSQVALIGYFMYIADGWYCAMFVGGMLLSHLDLLAATNNLPMFIRRLEPLQSIIWYHMLVAGIYLGGVPSENTNIDQLAQTRGWYFLSFLKPQAVFDYKWFYLFWAAVFLVASVSKIRWIRNFFETRMCQYLGRVSFALYLVHGPILATLGDRLYTAVGFKATPQMENIPNWVDKFVLQRTGPVGLEFAFLLPHVILLPVTLYAADIVTRAVDVPTVQFAAWAYKRTLPGVAGKNTHA